MLIDAHLHLWDPRQLDYPWLREHPSLERSFGWDELNEQAGDRAPSQVVFVQCDCIEEQADQELAWVRERALEDDRLAAAVVFAPLERGQTVEPWLEEIARVPLVRGVRRLLQGEPDPLFCLRPEFLEGVRLLARFDFTFDVCVIPEQLPAVVEMVRQVPEVRFVLDHLGKPEIRGGKFEPWAEHLLQLAECSNVVAKLSGLTTEADVDTWREEQLAPYLDHAFACFGPQRLLFGGDWPVATLATTYPRWVSVVEACCERWGAHTREPIFAGNAQRTYRLS